jgi:hypothetical protein
MANASVEGISGMSQAAIREKASQAPPVTTLDTVRYTKDMLLGLRQMAEKQGNPVLAHLLALALMEAEALIAGR